MADKFLVIDGSSLLHRAFYALPPLTTRSGVNTGAVYGFCNMLGKLLEEVNPKWLAIAFDKSRKTFRTEIFSDYKGQRKPTPSELKEQFPLARKVLEAMNITVLELDGYEADDIIGTFAVHADKDAEVIVVTGDKDELQLLDSRVKVYFTKRGISDIKKYDVAAFKEDYEGLLPKQLIDLKGLMGDASDNIPGVPGVGPKTALKLICEYGSVENVLENIEAINGKSLKEKLTTNKEMALLSKKLATIFTEVPVELDLAQYQLREMSDSAQSLMQELEFRNIYERFVSILGSETGDLTLFGQSYEVEPKIASAKKVLQTSIEAEKIFAEIKKFEGITSFSATFQGEPPSMKFVKIELCFNDTIYSIEEGSGAWEAFYSWLKDEKQKKATCDSKEIYKTCLCLQKEVHGIVEDLSIGAYLVDPGRSSYDLKTIAQRYLNSNNNGDAQDLEALIPIFSKDLEEHELLPLYKDIELPLAKLLAQMEVTGIKTDVPLLEAITKELGEQIEKLEALAFEQAGESFNLKSPKQLGVVLFENLGLPVIKKTKTGYSTDVSVLEQLEKEHPLIATILAYRKLTKLHSTYLEGMRPLINPISKRIHTHFQQMVTTTGRLSSTDPNLQNIPVRTDIGKRIREIFIPGDGYDWLMSCDYSQVELRVLAHIAQDELLLESFNKGQDVHARTAAEVFGVAIEDVDSTMRTRAKAVNFGIVYGISDFGLAKQLEVGRNVAGEYIKNYLDRYTGVKNYMDKTILEARENGYVTTMFGRRRYLPDIKHSNFNLRSFAERTAINTPIQGTAADIIKIAMLKVAAALAQANVKSRILLQVHDELVLEVTEAEREFVAALIKKTMEEAVELSIPLVADVAWGKNWAEAK